MQVKAIEEDKNEKLQAIIFHHHENETNPESEKRTGRLIEEVRIVVSAGIETTS